MEKSSFKRIETGFTKWLNGLRLTSTPSPAELTNLYSEWWSVKTALDKATAERTVKEHAEHIKMHINVLENDGVSNYRLVYGLNIWQARVRVSEEIRCKSAELKQLENFNPDILYVQAFNLA